MDDGPVCVSSLLNQVVDRPLPLSLPPLSSRRAMACVVLGFVPAGGERLKLLNTSDFSLFRIRCCVETGKKSSRLRGGLFFNMMGVFFLRIGVRLHAYTPQRMLGIMSRGCETRVYR